MLSEHNYRSLHLPLRQLSLGENFDIFILVADNCAMLLHECQAVDFLVAEFHKSILSLVEIQLLDQCCVELGRFLLDSIDESSERSVSDIC